MTHYFIMFLEYLAEAGEVECLVVLYEHDAEVELAERQHDAALVARMRLLLLVDGRAQHRNTLHDRASPLTQSRSGARVKQSRAL